MYGYFSGNAAFRKCDGLDTMPNLLPEANHGLLPIYGDSFSSSNPSTTRKSSHNSGIIQLECISTIFEGRELGILRQKIRAQPRPFSSRLTTRVTQVLVLTGLAESHLGIQ
jgi:hypothetical protein